MSDRRWREHLADARRLVREAMAARGAKRRALYVQAARVLVYVVDAGEPREKLERAAFRRTEWAVEKLIGAHGCAGCLAMVTLPDEAKEIERIQAEEGPYWYPLCGRHYRVAYRPKIDIGTTYAHNRGDECHVCPARATHEYTPHGWASIRRGRRKRK